MYKRQIAQRDQIEEKRAAVWRQARATDRKILEVAKEYANGRYKKLLAKLKKAITPDFPDVDIFFTVDLEKDGDKDRFKPDGKANVRLVVLEVQKRELDFPDEVRQEMIDLQAESQALFDEVARLWKDFEDCQRKANIDLDYAPADMLSLIHISEPTRPCGTSRMPSSA